MYREHNGSNSYPTQILNLIGRKATSCGLMFYWKLWRYVVEVLAESKPFAYIDIENAKSLS